MKNAGNVGGNLTALCFDGGKIVVFDRRVIDGRCSVGSKVDECVVCGEWNPDEVGENKSLEVGK